MQTLNQHLDQSSGMLRFVALKCGPFFQCKMTQDHSRQGVSQALVFLNTVFDPLHPVFGGQLKEDPMSFVDVGPKSGYQQFMLEFEDGPEGLILELFGWSGLAAVQV